MKDALMRVIKAALRAKELNEKMLDMGYGKTPYADIYGELADALFIICGEHTNRIDESFTYMVLNNPLLCLERRAALLEHVRISNTVTAPKMSAPNTCEPEEFEQLVRKNGGYSAKTGYVSPHEVDEKKTGDTPEGEWE